MLYLGARLPLVGNLSRSVDSSTLIFWSGGDKAKTAAANLAKHLGGNPLEITRRGAYLEKKGFVPDVIWRAASTNFANVASETARVVQLSAVPSIKSIW